MSTQTVIVNEVDVKGYKLSVTTRDAGDDPKHLEEITYRTIVVWLLIADKLEQGDYVLAGDTVEREYVAFMNSKPTDTDGSTPTLFDMPEAWGEPRVTVWDTYRSNKSIHFHLNSDDVPQIAINTWLANHNAIKRIEEKYKNASQSTQDRPPQSATPPERPATPKSQNAPQNAVEGAIVATRAPSKARQYADGQLLIFSINKVVKGTNKGSVTFNCWGDLGKNYALKTIYMTKSGSEEKSADYMATKDVLEGLNLSVDAGKIEAHGNWKLVTKVAHGKNGKGEETEFFNAVSLTVV